MSGCRSPTSRISRSACFRKYQLTDIWELGGQAVYRSKIYGGTLLAANEGTSIPNYWRFDAFAEAKINKNWKVKLFVNNIFNKLYYDALVPERGRRSFWKRRGAPPILVHLGEVSDRQIAMLISIPDVLSRDDVADFRRIMDAGKRGKTAALLMASF